MRRAAALLACLLLASCTTVRTVYRTVEVPVPGPCPVVTVPERPEMPVMPPEATDASRVRVLILALAVALGYAEELETLLRAAGRPAGEVRP